MLPSGPKTMRAASTRPAEAIVWQLATSAEVEHALEIGSSSRFQPSPSRSATATVEGSARTPAGQHKGLNFE